MNYLPFVSNHMYGGATAKERANAFVSWGLMIGILVETVVGVANARYRNIGYILGQFLKKTTRWM